MPIPTEAERLGTRIADKYELTSIVGRGGMGTVYRGKHAWTGREVAVKLLKPALTDDEKIVRRFFREARAASSVRHPNVVEVLDMGRAEDGAVYMVLELLEGESLGSMLRRLRKLAPEELLAIVVPIADALVAVHEQGLVHRDLKPDNIFVAREHGRDVPKLLDFGIAKILEDTGGSQGTRTGAIVGTPHYMSPEQAAGKKEVTSASDIWSLGVVLYEGLSGKLPFVSETTTGVLVKILTSPAAPLASRISGLPPSLLAIVERAMQPEPADRFASMREMEEALAECSVQLGLDVRSSGPTAEGALRGASTGAMTNLAIGDVAQGPDPETLASHDEPASGASIRRTVQSQNQSGLERARPAPSRGRVLALAALALAAVAAFGVMALEMTSTSSPEAPAHAGEQAPVPDDGDADEPARVDERVSAADREHLGADPSAAIEAPTAPTESPPPQAAPAQPDARRPPRPRAPREAAHPAPTPPVEPVRAVDPRREPAAPIPVREEW